METNKQKAIREAYGEHWEAIKQHVDENGYLHHPKGGEVTFDPFIGFMDEHPTEDAYRPKSLAGIDTNNGWISIESEADLPIDNEGEYYIIDKLTGRTYSDVHYVGNDIWIKGEYILETTHYQKMITPKKPIY